MKENEHNPHYQDELIRHPLREDSDSSVENTGLERELTDADIEDPFLEDALISLSPSPILSERISIAIDEPTETRFKWWRYAAVAAIFVVGLALGLLLPLNGIDDQREAEASTLQNELSAFNQGARFIADEARLLPENDPNLSATLFLNQLQMSALSETGRNILSIIQKSKSGDAFKQEQQIQLQGFFTRAVSLIDQMKTTAESGNLTRDDLELIRVAANRIVVPRELSTYQARTITNVRMVRVTDPSLQPYIDAKKYIFIGDYDRAIPILESNKTNAPQPLRQLVSYWLARSYIASDNPDKATVEISTLPSNFQVFFPSNLRATATATSGHFSIQFSVGMPRQFRTMHVLRRGEGGTLMLLVHDDGSVTVQEGGILIETYPSLSALKSARTELYDSIFPKLEQEQPAE